MQKILPWSITGICLAALVAVTFYFRDALAVKDGELQSLRQASAASAAEADAKLKAANERIAVTDATATQRVAAADAKAQEVAAQAATKVQEASEQAAARVQQVTSQATADRDALAAEARSRLLAANLPEASVDVIFRKALLSNGGVATIRDTSSASVPFTIIVARPSTNQTRQVPVVIDGGRVAEIGEREGWAFLPGDLVRVTQPGHKPREFTAR